MKESRLTLTLLKDLQKRFKAHSIYTLMNNSAKVMYLTITYFSFIFKILHSTRNREKCCSAKKAVVHHFGSVSWADYAFKRVFLTEKNRFLFLFKHYRGLSLLKALTLHDFKNTFQMMRKKAKFGLTVDILNQAKGHGNRSKSKYFNLINAAADWVCAKFLAYLILIQLFTTVRRNRR